MVGTKLEWNRRIKRLARTAAIARLARTAIAAAIARTAAIARIAIAARLARTAATTRIKQTAIVCLVFLAVCVPDPSYAEVSFEISVEKEMITLDESTQLNLTFYGTQSVSTPKPPQLDGFRVRYQGPSSRMSIVNGRVSSSITHVYRLMPIKTGKFRIGPFAMRIKGVDYQSNSVTVQVYSGSVPRSQTKPYSSSSQPSASTQSKLDERLFILMEPEKKTAYVNEIIPLNIKLYVSGLSLRDVQYPTFQHENFTAEDFDKPDQYPKVVSGERYEVLDFKTNIFATRPGEFEIGPARVKGNVLVRKSAGKRRRSAFDDFFDDDFFNDFLGGYDLFPIDLESVNIPMTILPLPEEGKPEDFKGAVGKFHLKVEVDTRNVKQGDPITLKMKVIGDGNFNTVTVPKLSSEENFKVYDAQVIEQENDIKEFEQVIIPVSTGVKEIPEVSFSCFDPATKQYSTITKGPFAIRVDKPDKEEQLKIVELPAGGTQPVRKEILGRDIVYIKESLGRLKKKDAYLYKSKFFIWMNAIPLLAFFGIVIVNQRSLRLRSDLRYASRIKASRRAKKAIHSVERALKAQETTRFYDEVFKNMQEYLGSKFHLPVGGITVQVVDERLRNKKIAKDVLDNIKDIFGECDMARYASTSLDRQAMQATYNKLRFTIEKLERIRV